MLERKLPMSLLVYEFIREAGTIIMLATVALIAGVKLKERVAIFLWMFSAWDIIYYAHLWLMIRWPDSLLSSDVLFLIPEPWFGQVWYPVLISGLTMLAVVINLKPEKHNHS